MAGGDWPSLPPLPPVRPAGGAAGGQLRPGDLHVPHHLHQRGEVLRHLLPPPLQGQGQPQACHLPPPGRRLQETAENIQHCELC